MPVKSMKEAAGSQPQKLDHGKRKPQKFTSVDQIRVALRVQNQDALVENLTALRNQLSIHPGEDAISPQDDRLLLAQHWLENVPGAHDIFEIWDSLAQRQNAILALLVAVLSSLLTLLSSHYTFQALGQPIMKSLLAPTYMRRLNSYVGGSHAELILVTLRLLNAMSAFSGGRERKSVLESFGWEIKSLPKLLNMRRKGRTDDTRDALVKPDIRTLYILFLLSFVDSDSPAQIKSAFLEQHREPFLSIFKGLVQDSYVVVRKILEVCWSGIWSDPKIKRTVKIGFFNEATISHIVKLYDRTAPEDEDPDHVPADLVHHFLLAICTRPGFGICFRDRGWYPRETDGDEDDEPKKQRGGKIYNKILANILKSLKVNEDVRQQELALKIMTACPELVSGYWAGAALTLEPRLSSKWISNISFFGSIISLPIPTSSFYLPNSTLYQPSPPPLSNVIENIFPSVNTKAHLSKGLQSTSGLVQHCTALALAKCLTKYEEVLNRFHDIETMLEENEADGQWCKRRRDIEREARRRVPDFQVIVAFSQQKFTDPVTNPNPTKAALLSESAQRLLWIYHRCLPSVVAEARFDVGKLLQSFSEIKVAKSDEPLDPAMRLGVVRQLHILRLLKDSDQFGWSAKMGSSSQSYLAVLLKTYIVSEIPATRTALSLLLQHVLSESIMFQEDPSEPYLWLISLPTSRRARGTESPDGAALTDEGDGVIAFLDDCVQRCLKTPYRYIEELYALGNTDEQLAVQDRLDIFPSPLLMTVLEQLEIKVTKKSLSPSDVLALASFVRKLGFRLSSKQQDLRFLCAVLQKFDAMLHIDRLFPEHPVITGAIRREVTLFKASLQLSLEVESSMDEDTSQQVQDFLAAVEEMSTPATKSARIAAAFELIDWLRLVEDTLRVEELRRLSGVLYKFYPPSLSHVAEYVVPAQASLWDGLNVVSRYSDLRQYLQFDFLFLHSTEAQLVDESCREILAGMAVGPVFTIVELKRAVCLITHRFFVAIGNDDLTNGLFLLLSSIIKRSADILSPPDFMMLKEVVFVRSGVIRRSLISESLSDTVMEGLRQLVGILDSSNKNDRSLIAETFPHWVHVLQLGLDGVQVSLPSLWIKYFQSADLFSLLDTIVTRTEMPDSSSRDILSALLEALRKLTTSEFEAELSLKDRLPQLLTLRPIMSESLVLEDLIAIAIEASLPAFCDGRRTCGAAFEETSLVSVVERAETRWSRQMDPSSTNLPVDSFLNQDSWTTSTVKILAGLIYQRSLSKKTFFSWLATGNSTGRSAKHLIPVMHAFLDICSSQDDAESLMDNDLWTSQLSRLLEAVLDTELPQDDRFMGGRCIYLILRLGPSCIPSFVKKSLRAIEHLPVTRLTHELLVIGRDLHGFAPEEAKPLLTALVDHGIQWAVRLFADDNTSFDNTVDMLTSLVMLASGIKPHLVETLMGVTIQNQLSNPRALGLITALLSNVSLKPVVINRHLQSVLQHPNFFKICANTASHRSSPRDSVVGLLYILFNLHPANTCQATHVEPLVRIYRGTLSHADGRILSIFRLFEIERKVSIASLLGRWSSSPNLLSSTSLEAIQSLDVILVLRTCLNFPRWRQLEDLSTDKASPYEAQLYDPVFLMLLFAQTFAEALPTSAVVWVELFRTNIVSLLIKALSSKDGEIRDVALCQLAALWQYLQTADMQEKPHVLYILTILKDVLPPPSEEPPRRLPSYTTLLLLHALRGIFYPSNFIYPITARFLLQRPELDTSDVPMLYNMLYSSSDDWKKERGWIIRFLSDGLMSTDDWRVLKRRHTWDLLASLFQSSEDDKSLRAGIFEVLASLTCNAQATTSLVLKSGLLSWIEIQLLASKNMDGIEWVKVLENIMAIASPEKLESSTNGGWRRIICRCLVMLLDNPQSTNTLAIFPFAIGALLRLSLLPGPPIPGLPILLNDALKCLLSLEASTIIPPTSIQVSPLHHPCTPLYRAHEIHEAFPCEDSLQIWGTAVESLWRVTMTLEEKPPAWDAITCRTLLWRALVGVDGSTLGEWTRTQVICNMAHPRGR
ncbi:Uncharacterized protein C14G10.02 [Hypsizygus marmoreus]|uniref:Uncharacterized protein C14G10.02 n=1 Tax=Hypsizygus marmoreus TaxID=39966 RepID=A0A369JDN6_HYPMA|nr:Uncharacterized protein C14G10.02 [Hypsizygus marmoreus]